MACGITDYNTVWWNTFGNYSSGTDNAPLSDSYFSNDDCSGSNINIIS